MELWILCMFIDCFCVLSAYHVDDRYISLLCEFQVQINAASVFMCKNSASVIFSRCKFIFGAFRPPPYIVFYLLAKKFNSLP